MNGENVPNVPSIYAIAEMNKRAEETTQKVRRELLRIGCFPRELRVLRQGSFLQFKHRQQIILADPDEVLALLRQLPDGLSVDEIWERINRTTQRESRGGAWTKSAVVIFACLLMVLLGLAIKLNAGDFLLDLFQRLHLTG